MTTNPKLFIPVGMPGCGKSTLAANLFGHAQVISSDAIRESFGDVTDMSNNDEVFKIYHDRIGFYLERGHDVYADATNLRDFARTKLGDIAREHNAETHVLMFTNMSEAIRRNTTRERVVPHEVMLRFIYQLEEALKAVPLEPFTSVTIIGGVQGVTNDRTR